MSLRKICVTFEERVGATRVAELNAAPSTAALSAEAAKVSTRYS